MPAKKGFCVNSRYFHVCLLVVCLFAVGCQQEQLGGNWLLLNFEKNEPITYQLTSSRQVTIDLTSGSSGKKSKPQTTSETLDLVITYTPTDVDPFGLTTIVAECKTAKVVRSSMSGRKNAADAMEQLAGKTFTLQLSPTGEIADDTDLRRITTELGEKAFAQSKNDTQRIKNPDMISDFIVMQWHLWDSTSTVEEPLDGMKPGKTWQVKQWIPWPIPVASLPSRLTTYTLDSFVTEENQPRKAVIKSTYAISESKKQDFPFPYEGRFQMRGLMGFLRNYKFLSLDGGGTQVFNMDKGLIESDEQHYTMKVNAAFMLPLGDSLPVLDVDQTISIKRIENP